MGRSPMSLPPLSLVQTRVLGVLVEKEHTVPDIYPLSLNALVSGCNQKNNRDPVLELTEAEVQAALDELRRRSLVIESSGSRVMRYEQNVGRVLKVPSQAVALLAVLFLRGPQTAGELRIGTERMHKFADISSVEAFLEELATRPETQGGALLVKLPRRPGERENRWAHLLSGPVAAPQYPDTVAVDATSGGDIERLAAEVAALREEVAALRDELRRVAPPR